MRCCRLPVLLLVSSLVFLIAPAGVDAQRPPRTLVALLAHADDETAAAPALARYAREGVQVRFVIATDGSGGSGAQTYLQRSETGPTGDALMKARADEARCAAAALGARDPILLAFPDGKLGDYLGDRTLMTRLTEALARQIATLHPDVVVTWGPDGGTGHPDHRIVSDIATQLLRAGVPGMPARLFYMYLPAGLFSLSNPQRGAPPMVLPQPQYFTVRVPFTPADLDASFTSMSCHRTQFNDETLQRFRAGMAGVWNGNVPFVPAASSMRGNDLFR